MRNDPKDQEKASLKDKVRHYADSMERMIHTNPSGVDVAISLNGGMLSFLKGATPAENVITIIDNRQSKIQTDMILVNTNKARNSKSTIEAVMRLKESDLDKFNSIMDEIGRVTNQVLKIYEGVHEDP